MSDELNKELEKLVQTKKSYQWVVRIMITIFVAQLSVFGAMTANVKNDHKMLNAISRDYVPAWFLEGMYDNMTYQTEEIVATLNGNSEKIKEINDKYIDFQKNMLNNLIKMRGGITNNTRSIKPNKNIP